jgi:methylmalonyl-CoA mutase
MQIRATRDSAKAAACLAKLTEVARTRNGNILAAAIDASRERCTVGEISDALEAVFGRYVATSHMVSGAYKSEYGSNSEIDMVVTKIRVRTVICVL